LKHEADEVILRKIGDLARFAWSNHCGFFVDGRLENVVLQIGRDIEVSKQTLSPVVARKASHKTSDRAKKNLLIASSVFEAGGHTRVLRTFIKRNKRDVQTLLLTRQGREIPQGVIEDAQNNGVEIILLENHCSLTEKGLIVRETSRSYDRVLLFTHPDDVIPVLAFAVESTPPVIVDNHAHYFFWLGTSVADLVFSHISYMNEVAQRRRFPKRTFLFPMPVVRDQFEMFRDISKEEAKKRVGLSADCLCILSMGRAEKYLPNRKYNFFLTAKKIVERYPEVHIIIIGVPPSHVMVRKYLGGCVERIRVLGTIEKPFIYHRAAEIFMESFPFPSGGSVVEAISYGEACPLYAYGMKRGILSRRISYNEEAFNTIIPETKTEDEYLEYLDELIRSPGLRRRIADHLKAKIIEIWKDHDIYREKLFDEVENVEHDPHTVCNAVAELETDDVDVAGISIYKSLMEVLTYFQRSSCQLSTANILNILFRLGARGLFIQETLKLAGIYVLYGLKVFLARVTEGRKGV
jgi:hypothetical protein